MDVPDNVDTIRKYNNIYLSIIMRYKEYIEECESLYIADLPKLITPSDPAVLAVSKGITDSFPSYSYERDFLEVARLSYLYLRDRITTLSIPVQFWQKPSETLENGAGDQFDKAVLLCSVLISVGAVSSKIIITITEGKRNFIIYSEYRGEIITVDPERGLGKAFDRNDLISMLNIKGDSETSAYEFNDRMYADIL